MKRSEIIRVISNFIYEHGVEPEDCEFEANKLLNKIREKGMLPPVIQKPLKYHNGKQLEVEYVNEWEQEDA